MYSGWLENLTVLLASGIVLLMNSQKNPPQKQRKRLDYLKNSLELFFDFVINIVEERKIDSRMHKNSQ